MHLDGKTVLITGAGSGIGRAIALEASKRGAYVVATDLRPESAAETAGQLATPGESHGLDVSDASDFARLADDVYERRGHIDVLVNNAGIGVGGDFRDHTEQDWQRIIDVNLWGVLNGLRAVYPRMAEKGSGQIANIASMAGLLPVPGMSAYATTKHAVKGLTLSLRAEAQVLGVGVSVVCPGVIRTPILDSPMRSVAEEKRKKMMKILMPMKKTEPEVAGRDICDGIERNLPIIFTPKWSRRYHRLWRFVPSLVWKQLNETARRLHKERDAS